MFINIFFFSFRSFFLFRRFLIYCCSFIFHFFFLFFSFLLVIVIIAIIDVDADFVVLYVLLKVIITSANEVIYLVALVS